MDVEYKIAELCQHGFIENSCWFCNIEHQIENIKKNKKKSQNHQIWRIKYRKNNPPIEYSNEQENRTYFYMEEQCKYLIDQLIDGAT